MITQGRKTKRKENKIETSATEEPKKKKNWVFFYFKKNLDV